MVTVWILTECLYYNSRLFTWRYLVRVWRAVFFITHSDNRRSTRVPAWNGFLSETDTYRLQSVIKKAKDLDIYHHPSAILLNFVQMLMKNFFSMRYNPYHVLHQLLPSVKTTSYNLRARSHNFKLPGNLTNLGSKNFINSIVCQCILDDLCCSNCNPWL